MKKLKFYKYKQEAYKRLMDFTVKQLHTHGFWQDVTASNLDLRYVGRGSGLDIDRLLFINNNDDYVCQYILSPFERPSLRIFTYRLGKVVKDISLSKEDAKFVKSALKDLTKVDIQVTGNVTRLDFSTYDGKQVFLSWDTVEGKHFSYVWS